MIALRDIAQFSFARWLGYLLVLLATEVIAGFDRPIGFNAALSVSLSATADDIVSLIKTSDYVIYVTMARMFSSEGFGTFREVLYQMFPPGLPILESVILRFWPGAPLIGILFALTLALWAAFLTDLSRLLKRQFRLPEWVCLLTPLVLLAAPFFRDAYLWTAVGLTESISTPFFAIACVGALRIMLYPSQNSWRKAIWSGALFAVASYIRAQFDLTFLAFAVAASFCLCGEWFRQRLSEKPPVDVKVHAFALLAMILTYQAATIPYKLYKHAPTMVVMNHVWEITWHNEAEIRHLQGDWIANGGVQSICEIAPEKCREFAVRTQHGETITTAEYEHATIHAALQRPVALLRYKLPYFWNHWFVDMWSLDLRSYSHTLSLILLFSIPFSILYSLRIDLNIAAVYALFSATLIASCTMFSVFVHIEARYFLPIKLFGAVSLIFVFLDFFFRRRAPISDQAAYAVVEQV